MNDVDYIVSTPDHRKQHQLCHVNMLKAYHHEAPVRTNHPIALPVDLSVSGERSDGTESKSEDDGDLLDGVKVKLSNSHVLKSLESKLHHLTELECTQLKQLILANVDIFPDVPSKTTVVYHDVDVGGA